jgi:hypothetical protein
VIPIALTACIALVTAALNVQTEGAILRHTQKAQKDWPKLGRAMKHLGIALVILAIVAFGIGCWTHFYPNMYVTSNVLLSGAVTLGLSGGLVAIKGIRLMENDPEKLGRRLRYGALAMAIIAVGFLGWGLVHLY